jgi:hypothetical protein
MVGRDPKKPVCSEDMAMNATEKNRILQWASLLESGEFAQTTGKLSRYVFGIPASVSYCCLGVACELVSVEHGGFWEDFPSGIRVFIADYASLAEGGDAQISSTNMLSGPVKEWLGIADSMGESLTSRLVHLNDTGATFMEIAWFLRRYVVTDDAERKVMLNWLLPALRAAMRAV